ncbi:hypothetical protein BJY01DRAFT_81654 [Aspergillus pseudoustus]|uniref:Zn(2)-C6 fungal-type domain-containing protein n=1 Tax=Aspergillus pseudoustus TaxID=1810923 RepID=A0ABR4J3L6_9EURO
MHPPRYSTSRQKACRQCATAKARCERRRESGNCVRCAQRDFPCSYTQSDAPKTSKWIDKDREEGVVHPATPFSLSQSSFSWLERGGLLPESAAADSDTRVQSQGANIPRITISTATPSERSRNTEPTAISPASSGSHDEVDFSSLDLTCPINADDIQNRWIQAYIPVPGQQVKDYPNGVARFIYRTLKSYAAAAVHGRGILPFIHAKQMVARLPGSPLTTCLSLVRICANQIPGSEHGAASVLQREMQAVYEGRSMYNAEALFAAFQAYLIYAMVLFFWLNENTDRHFRDIMTNLQELACASARHGLVCAADQQRARPRWEEWIVAEAKRRTLFVMYLFDSILSTQEGLPTFLGIELHGLPAPANKLLWQASNWFEWEREYNVHLVDWMEGSLTIDELWPTPPDLDENAVARRADRADRWLENLDEYGTMFYAIMQCTHGG